VNKSAVRLRHKENEHHDEWELGLGFIICKLTRLTGSRYIGQRLHHISRRAYRDIAILVRRLQRAGPVIFGSAAPEAVQLSYERNLRPSRYPDIPITVQAIKAGADDFLTKPVSSEDLLQAVERAIAHNDVARSLKSKLDLVRAHVSALTPRERQVFDLVIRGDTNKHIAGALGCTERTIKAHRHRMMEKMRVRSVAELVSLAERVGVLDSAPSGPGSPDWRR
jgi:DNA-binding CsgD family transcriptional regulator